MTPWENNGVPSSSRITTAWSRTHIQVPSRCRNRYSASSGSSVAACARTASSVRSRSSGCRRLRQRRSIERHSSGPYPKIVATWGLTYTGIDSSPRVSMYVTDGSVSIRDRYRRSASCIACSAAMRSPTSIRKPWLNRGRPSSSRTIEAWSRNHHTVPSLAVTRCSTSRGSPST